MRALRLSSFEVEARPSAARVAGLSGALFVNLLALGALTLPIALPYVIRQERPPAPTDDWVPYDPVNETLPSPVPSPSPIPAPDPIVLTPPQPVDQAPPLVDGPVIPDAVPETIASIPFDPPPVTPTITTSGTADVESLAYEYAPSPRYPAIAVRKRWEGVVLLEVLVGQDGLPIEVRVLRSSGYPDLDKAARRRVLEDWRFKPAMRDGMPVRARGRVPIEFTLGSG